MNQDIFRRLSFGVKKTKSAKKVEAEEEHELRLRILPENIKSDLVELKARLAGDVIVKPSEDELKNEETHGGIQLMSGKSLVLDENEDRKGNRKRKLKTLQEQDEDYVKEKIRRQYTEKITQLRRLNRIFTWGENIPDPLVDFSDLKLPGSVQDSLIEFGIKEPTPIQMQAIPLLIQRRNVLCSAPTGSGKTIAFALPVILDTLNVRLTSSLSKKKKTNTNSLDMSINLKAIVLEPTRELASQTYRQFLKYAQGTTVKVALFEDENVPKNVDVLVSTPNRICHHLDQLNLQELRWLVVDESDRLFEVIEGQDRCFRTQLATIYKACDGEDVRRAFFSATYSFAVENWCKESLKDVVMVCIGSKNSSNVNVKQELIYAGDEHGKVIAIKDVLMSQFEPPALIFVQSKERARELVVAISKFKPPIPVSFISSEKSQAERETVLEEFRSGKIWILVCTELMGRGLDLKNVNLVINFDLPTSIVSYIHRIGRTGRAGRHGRAITYFTEADTALIRPIATVIHQAGFQVPEYTLSLKNVSRNDKFRFARHAPKRRHVARLKKKHPFKKGADKDKKKNHKNNKKSGGKAEIKSANSKSAPPPKQVVSANPIRKKKKIVKKNVVDQ